MTTAFRQGLLGSFGDISVAHLRRHPYMYVSIALHAVLLALMFYYGSYAIELKRHEEQLSVMVNLAIQTRTEERVQDMEKIKSLLEQSASKAPANDSDAGHSEDEVQFSASSLTKQPQELLKEAKALSESIDNLRKDLKAEALAKILHIPKKKALEQVKLKPPAPEPPPAPASTDPKEVAEEIRQLEAKAREALVARQQELEGTKDGVLVAGAQHAGHQSSGNNADETNRGTAGKGGGVAAFVNRDAPVSKNALKNYNWSGEEMSDLSVGSLPEADSDNMIKGMGRLIGTGGEFADRVYINSWYLIGPFEGKHGRELFANYSYPPEERVLLDAVYLGKGDRLLKWQYVNTARYPLIPPDVAEDAVYYGYTELMLDQAKDLTMSIGADDDVQVWLNDRLVWAGGNVNKKWFFDLIYNTRNTYFQDFNLCEGKLLVHFKKGRNKVVFKLANGPDRLFLSMVLAK